MLISDVQQSDSVIHMLFVTVREAATAHRARPRGATPRRRSGQKPGGPHARGAAAKRSYLTSEVRGSSRKCQAGMTQERQRRATQVQGQGWQPRGATPPPRSGAAAGKSCHMPEARGRGREDQPHVQGAVAVWAQEDLEELSHVEGQELRL